MLAKSIQETPESTKGGFFKKKSTWNSRQSLKETLK